MRVYSVQLAAIIFTEATFSFDGRGRIAGGRLRVERAGDLHLMARRAPSTGCPRRRADTSSAWPWRPPRARLSSG